jgi:hypothetical protein
VHFLVSHPTPPVFDGPEDRNARRNFDEIRFWTDYISPGQSGYIYDDDGVHGGLTPGALFVIAGDENSDPLDGDSIPGATQQLLDHPLVSTRLTPESAGAVEASALQSGANLTHWSDPRFDTADFADVPGSGNLHADYVLPRKNIQIVGGGVFWPVQADPLFRLTVVFDPAQWGPVGGLPDLRPPERLHRRGPARRALISSSLGRLLCRLTSCQAVQSCAQTTFLTDFESNVCYKLTTTSGPHPRSTSTSRPRRSSATWE